MRFYRANRVSTLILEELGKIMLREFEFNGALATITSVEVDKKLEHAVVNVSILPAANEEGIFALLQKNIGHMQHLLNHKLNIKPMPRISFALDHGLENAAKVEKLLEEDDTIEA